MKIDAVDLFYLSMPEVLDIADGSQDALLVRLRAGNVMGWGECEASPLVSIANWVCPMSHSIARPVRDSVLGQKLDDIVDIDRIARLVAEKGLDIAQTDHTFSGIEIAMWDLLGRKREQPVYEMLGYERAYPKTPYASQLFGDTAQDTFQKAKASAQAGYRAVKFGWGPYGHTTPEADRDQVDAARRGLGPDGALLIDAGTAWDDVSMAEARLPALAENNVVWLEEPFVGGDLDSYGRLASLSGSVKLAGGEGAHDFLMAKHLIDHGGIGFVQIDTGRIGGIGPAKAVCDYATARGVKFVNHTFTTHLALSASLAPFAGVQDSQLCEYPVEPTLMAQELNKTKITLNRDMQVELPQAPGLGVEPDEAAMRKYLIDVEIKVGGRVLYTTPQV